MSDADKLAEIRRRLEAKDRLPHLENTQAGQDISWLLGEVERLRGIGARLLYHDERGQGVGWQDAMADLLAALPETEMSDD